MPARNRLALILHLDLAQPVPKASAIFHLEPRESGFPADYRKLQRRKHRFEESVNTTKHLVGDLRQRAPTPIVDRCKNGFPRHPRRLLGLPADRLTLICSHEPNPNVK